MDPWNLVLDHRYSAALEAYEANNRRGLSEDAFEIANRSTVLLCLGRLSEALNGFEYANQLASRQLHGETQPYLNYIGAILWLQGKRDDAIQIFTAAVDGVLNGSIKFADNAGGVSQGLLLWYAGITTPNNAAKAQALMYLDRLSNKSRIKDWPGPLALHALGKINQEDLLRDASDCLGLEMAINQSKTDVMMRRKLVRMLFYNAVGKRSSGAEAACQTGMIQCANVENPIIEIEWYLAKAEAKLAAMESQDNELK